MRWFSSARRSFFVLGVALVAMFALTTGVARAYKQQRAALAANYAQQARDLAAEHRYDQAIEQYRRALEFDPSDPTYRLLLAQALVETGRFTEAEAHLGELHEEDPMDAVVNRTLARIYARQRDMRGAVSWYHRAIYGMWPTDASKNRIETRWELVELLARHGQRQQAIAELLELLGEAPDDARLRLRIGRRLLDFGAASNAEEVFQDVITANPRFADGYLALADAQMAQRKYTDARNALRRAWRLNPHDPNTWKRIETVNDIIDLDPALPTLSSEERLHRGRELLNRTLSSLQQCAGSAASPQVQADIAAGQDMLHPKRKLPREGQIPRNISMAMQLWHDRAQACHGAPADPVLSAVLSMMEKQQ